MRSCQCVRLSGIQRLDQTRTSQGLLAEIQRVGKLLKHADHDGSATYDFKPEETEYVLLFAIKWYRDLGNATTPTMVVFLTWFGACHPNMIAKGANDLTAEAIRQAAQHARYLDRDERLRTGADLLAKMNCGG